MESLHSESPATAPAPDESESIAAKQIDAAETDAAHILPPQPAPPEPPEPWETRALLKILMGPKGLRAGWSIAAFIVVFFVFVAIAGFVLVTTHLIDPKSHEFTATSALFNELDFVIGMVGAAAVVALLERRRGNPLAYNLQGPGRTLHFVEGLIAGFVALSALIFALKGGGWLHFGPVALSGGQIFRFAALWGIAFLLVGCFEEGIFRCYLQFTLTRGINLWWALGIEAVVCAKLLIFNSGNGNWGIYGLVLLGLVPCVVLALKKAESAGFWLAAWVTSTLFGFIHTGNNGENWIGIFAAGAIGFVFVVSVRVTGTAWWAIGCHAAWDWAETYFYGAADSGNVAVGHYLTTTPAGSPLWSGGSDGPEGSVLVIGIVLLLIAAILLFYRRRESDVSPALISEASAG